MKKYYLFAAVISSFLGYSFYQKVFSIHTTPTNIPITRGTAHPVTDTPTPTNAPTPIQTSDTTAPSVASPTNTPTPTQKPFSLYKDGTYTGDVADAFYGNIQVQATITNGKITNVQFLQYPNDRGRSIEINQQADPMLTQEAIQNQTAQVDVVSGATDSSQAFTQSLQSALDKAKS